MVHLWNQLSLSIHEGTMLHTPSRQEEPVSGPALFARAERTAGSIVAACDGRTPRRVGLLMANGEPWVRGLLALLRLDAATVPLALPVAFGGADAYAAHVRRIAADASLDALLVDGSLGSRIVSRVAAAVPHLPFIDIAEPPHDTVELPAVRGGGSAPAVIQYTSGSTSDECAGHPRGRRPAAVPYRDRGSHRTGRRGPWRVLRHAAQAQPRAGGPDPLRRLPAAGPGERPHPGVGH